MQTHLQMWGNSLGLRIPTKLSRQLKIKAGSKVELKIEKGHLIIAPQRYNLHDMVDQITLQNCHHELFGQTIVGHEEW